MPSLQAFALLRKHRGNINAAIYEAVNAEVPVGVGACRMCNSASTMDDPMVMCDGLHFNQAWFHYRCVSRPPTALGESAPWFCCGCTVDAQYYWEKFTPNFLFAQTLAANNSDSESDHEFDPTDSEHSTPPSSRQSTPQSDDQDDNNDDDDDEANKPPSGGKHRPGSPTPRSRPPSPVRSSSSSSSPSPPPSTTRRVSGAKRFPGPSATRRSTSPKRKPQETWTDKEIQIVGAAVKKVYARATADGRRLGEAEKLNYAVKQLRKAGYERNVSSVRNWWNRNGRKTFKIDERAPRKDGKKRKQATGVRK